MHAHPPAKNRRAVAPTTAIAGAFGARAQSRAGWRPGWRFSRPSPYSPRCLFQSALARAPRMRCSAQTAPDAGSEPEASLGTASVRLKIEQSEFELLPKHKLFRHGHVRHDQWAPTDHYFGRVSIISNAADVPDVVYSMEGQPEQSSYQFCEYKRDDCQDVEIGVGDTSGHLYLHIDLGQARLGYRHGVTYVPDFPEQPVELAAAESGSALRVFREVLVKPSSRVPRLQRLRGCHSAAF